MITDELIKKEFIHQVMSRDIKRIYYKQESIVKSELNKKSGDLLDFLVMAPFTNTSGMGKEVYYMRLFAYLRFLDIRSRQDMRLRRKLALYNRTVWGVLYHETFPTLSYGFSKDVQSYIKTRLQNALPIDPYELTAIIDY